MSDLRAFISANRSRTACSVPSVCSAHPDVLRASIGLAKTLNQPLLIEATSNQVNQFGGYTGMTPADFFASVHAVADDVGCPAELLHLGGDHLGPQAWKAQPPEVAMRYAADMIRDYVQAGFTKIHLDCSEGCAGEPAQLPDEVTAERSARLAQVALAHAPDPSRLLFVIGTEVPPPGGHRPTDAEGIRPTTPDAARATLAVHRAAFDAIDPALCPHVGALVVQPGVEFSADHIDRFNTTAPDHLSAALANHPHIAFEAHSTDYQADAVYPALAKRHFVFQKIGPALTFAYRQALYQLSALDVWENGTPAISDTLERAMLADPGHWHGRYLGDAAETRRLRHFSWADRIRYYWPAASVRASVAGLRGRLAQLRPSVPQMRQFLEPDWADAEGSIRASDESWHDRYLLHCIQKPPKPYFCAPLR